VSDHPFVTYSDHVEALRQAATRERLSGQVQMMDEIARCIADGHRGNGSAEDDVCCQVCEEIQCDPDCAIAVHVEALRQDVQRGYDLGRTDGILLGQEQGQRDMLAEAVRRVEALDVYGDLEWSMARQCVIATIKGDQP